MDELSTKPFVYEAADLRALNWEVVRWWTLLPYFLILGGLVWLFGSLMIEEGTLEWPFVAILIVLVGLASGPWTWRPLLMRRFLRRNGLLGPQTMRIEADSLSTHSDRGDGSLRWSAVTNVKKTHHRLFVFSGKSVAHIIPSRAFESDAEFEAFAEAARDRWTQLHGLQGLTSRG